eukprot:CAMPEP_0170364596 /NCGR_PEP_ID=MMETSP0117_2-20130122/5459_1 /TAXON_ID=400756 /ORGANISM="Durinskia baltica, Strain CSIRO CS-38" /LENGTH=271 /DNA_ID=CAMNT_0010619109 /DNA_START=81 /DNA_END=896 /DNA_ORIENTATION=-
MMIFRAFICCAILAFTSANFAANLRQIYSNSVSITPQDGACTDPDYPKDCGVTDDGNQVECCPSGYDCPEQGSDQCTKDTSCFSSTDEVTLLDGTNILISELSAGDKVLSWSNGKFTHSEVVFLPHPKNDQQSEFVKLTLKSGRSIKATPSHILPAGSCSTEGDLPLVSAGEIVSGQCLRSLSGLDEVMQIEKVADNGVYTLVTNDEFVVVNGIVASPFASNHYVVNKFYNIHRAIYAMWPSMLTSPSLKMREMTLLVGSVMLGVTGYKSQ